MNVCGMSHRKWREIKQQLIRLPGLALLGCSFLSLHILCDILQTFTVQSCFPPPQMKKKTIYSLPRNASPLLLFLLRCCGTGDFRRKFSRQHLPHEMSAHSSSVFGRTDGARAAQREVGSIPYHKGINAMWDFEGSRTLFLRRRKEPG